MESEEVFTYYAHDIYRYLLSLSKDHHLAEDLLQETFYRAHVSIHELSADKIKPWLFRVSYNLFIDYLRKNKRITFMEDEKNLNVEDVLDIENEVMIKINIEMIKKQINSLPINQRNAIILSDINDLSYEECAEILGVSISGFKSTLYRARQKIRKNYEVNSNEDKR